MSEPQFFPKAVSDICSRLDDIRDVIGYAGNVMGDERDAMAWQVFVAMHSVPSAYWYDHHPTDAYAAADAFLAERKRQQGEA